MDSSCVWCRRYVHRNFQKLLCSAFAEMSYIHKRPQPTGVNQSIYPFGMAEGSAFWSLLDLAHRRMCWEHRTWHRTPGPIPGATCERNRTSCPWTCAQVALQAPCGGEKDANRTGGSWPYRNKKLLVARSFLGNRFTCSNKKLLGTRASLLISITKDGQH